MVSYIEYLCICTAVWCGNAVGSGGTAAGAASSALLLSRMRARRQVGCGFMHRVSVSVQLYAVGGALISSSGCCVRKRSCLGIQLHGRGRYCVEI